jgi:DNA-binding transcriptional MerR regulator
MHGRPTARLLTIGQLGRITGVPVRTIRFYSDEGLIEPTARSGAGYRLYDAAAAVRLDLVRTLRDLGIDLPTIAKVLAQEVTVAEVARAHAEALEATVRTLRVRQAVLRAVAVRDSAWEEMAMMHQLARLDAAERKRILDGFLDTVFGGLPEEGGRFETMIRQSFPTLPDEPTQQQVEAWVELVTLIQDDTFVARVRQMAVRGAAKDLSAGQNARHQEAFGILAAGAGEAHGRGLDPTSEEATALVRRLAAGWAAHVGKPDTAEGRAGLRESLAAFNDERVDRFWRLVAIVGDLPERPGAPSFATVHWLVTALGHAG